ncbi:ATP-binding cassette domain-containing protein [Tabrizicola caldifontis]|uniref:ATP-binding cassette domain-containing protein n=1 Tax=Tabrizicola caldifontis TaxID=2528036 RepID=UPI001F10AC60|nr:ATP-binding cassette domain-containing protein [Rhodobacter sp. YIM 73028]
MLDGDRFGLAGIASRNGKPVVTLGPSGSGESALLHLIAGLEEVMAGEIAIAGQVVNHLEPRERGCAMVFHGHALIHTWRWGKTSAMR